MYWKSFLSIWIYLRTTICFCHVLPNSSAHREQILNPSPIRACPREDTTLTPLGLSTSSPPPLHGVPSDVDRMLSNSARWDATRGVWRVACGARRDPGHGQPVGHLSEPTLSGTPPARSGVGGGVFGRILCLNEKGQRQTANTKKTSDKDLVVPLTKTRTNHSEGVPLCFIQGISHRPCPLTVDQLNHPMKRFPNPKC